jgi:hypothetical protein
MDKTTFNKFELPFELLLKILLTVVVRVDDVIFAKLLYGHDPIRYWVKLRMFKLRAVNARTHRWWREEAMEHLVKRCWKGSKRIDEMHKPFWCGKTESSVCLECAIRLPKSLKAFRGTHNDYYVKDSLLFVNEGKICKMPMHKVILSKGELTIGTKIDKYIYTWCIEYKLDTRCSQTYTVWKTHVMNTVKKEGKRIRSKIGIYNGHVKMEINIAEMKWKDDYDLIVSWFMDKTFMNMWLGSDTYRFEEMGKKQWECDQFTMKL